MKLGLPLGSHRTQHASYNIREERLGDIFRELRKTGSHLGLNRGPLTLAVSALPPELWLPMYYAMYYHTVPYWSLYMQYVHCTCCIGLLIHVRAHSGPLNMYMHMHMYMYICTCTCTCAVCRWTGGHTKMYIRTQTMACIVHYKLQKERKQRRKNHHTLQTASVA